MGEVKLSMTALALGLREAEAVVPVWLESRDWHLVGEQVLAENLLQKPSAASTRRIYRELCQRLQMLQPATLEAFSEGGADERRQILFLAACKTYPFLFHFITGPLRDKLAVFDTMVRSEDFVVYWNHLALESPALDDLKESTRKKVHQIVIRLLSEAGLLSSTRNPHITPIHLTARMREILSAEGTAYLQVFLTP